MLQFVKSPPETIFATGHAHKGLWALNKDKRLRESNKNVLIRNFNINLKLLHSNLQKS